MNARFAFTSLILLMSATLSKAVDTDSDGLDDAVETNTGVYVDATHTGTNPNNPDSDDDGVPDGLEVKEKTSPVDAIKFNSFSKGMIAFWPFNGNATDETGRGNNGEISNVEFVADRYLEAASSGSFNGVNSTIRINTSITSGEDLTISFWALYTPPSDGSPSWSILHRDSWQNGFVHFGVGSLNVACSVAADSPQGFAVSPYSSGNWNTNAWNHIVFVRSGNKMKASFYINGLPFGSQDQNFLYSQASISPCQIGAWKNIYGYLERFFSGRLDDLRIYNRDLSDQEVVELFRSETPQFQIIQGSYTWQQAKADAEARGGRLAVLNTQKKIDDVTALLDSAAIWPNLWIGLTDELVEGDWRWIDGAVPSVTKWASGEPDSHGGLNEDGGVIFTSEHGLWPGYWADAEQTQSFSYLLEKLSLTYNLTLISTSFGSINGSGIYEPGASAILTAVPDSGYVFTGWTGEASGTENPLKIVMNSDKTIGATFAPDAADNDGDGFSNYHEIVIYGTDPDLADTDGDGLGDAYELGIGRYSIIDGFLRWGEAKADAESKGGTLATFASEDEWNRALFVLGDGALGFYTGLWLGGTDAAVEGTWEWVTGERFGFVNWAAGEPDNVSDADALEVSGGFGATPGLWRDTPAAAIREGYILETGYPTDPTDPDSDDDGLNDGDEQAAGSNPFLTDTDNDGLTDGQEVNLTHTNPTLTDTDGNGTGDAEDDSDDDGLSNLAEITQYGTDPLDEDSDNDGLKDGAEVNFAASFFKLVTGSFTYPQAAADAASKRGRIASFPDSADYTRIAYKARQTTQGYLWIGLSDASAEGTWVWTDGTTASYSCWLNGEPSGAASENHSVIMENSTQWADTLASYVSAGYIFERVGLDPLDPDTDGDGLSDGQEVNTILSNPVLDDTDGDGLQDGAEVNTHGSSPLLEDTDEDGLSDRAEVEVHGSNPSLKDSDEDGFDDGFEVNTGFNPALATSTPDALSSIRTAVEFRFNAANGVSYRIEVSTDLVEWSTIETNIIGQSAVVTRFYSIENQPKRYFRVRRN